MGEDKNIDHLVFVVHGIGPFADIRLDSFRSLIDCVDDFREVSLLLLRSHDVSGRGAGGQGRVEFLPVQWHSALHGDDTGVDKQVKSISLPSISKLRDFTNSTLIDILFYTSPLYLQTIIDQVSSEMNRMYALFKERNPSFTGSVGVMGHSLGSCILFDLLYHQKVDGGVSMGVVKDPVPQSLPVTESTDSLEKQEEKEKEEGEDAPAVSDILNQLGLPQLIEKFESEMIDFNTFIMCNNEDLKEIGVPLGGRKKITSYIDEWNKKKEQEQERKVKEAEERLREEELKKSLAADGACVGGVTESVTYVKGTAGTGQPLVNYPLLNFNPSSLFAVGSPIGLFLTLRGVESLGPEYQLPTCSSVYNIFHPYDPVAYRLEPLLVSQAPLKAALLPHHKGRKRFHLELYENIEKVGQSVKYHLVEGIRNMWHQLNELARAHTNNAAMTTNSDETESIPGDVSSQGSVDEESVHIPIGCISGGDRVDHVLQEKPIETINEYMFALSSHLCYWRSEDTALFILKQLYKNNNNNAAAAVGEFTKS
ncbi:PREDICTED: SEC23-interacting protein-like [Amphimedon queenslandica]|uniref:DDHD domain-containing protein n=2 Tax=Amphimedon queenslandica TaxID=400682 RepID=A0AAN0IRU0_AMPQE|nr:PREDICTED: SEC23-interacting protein-like [Amphimedon queenslandica]|eukprot:XP_011407929.1 PREDICTED: SEC23-interacting protein-like [Amphimedon queenslandica]